MKTYHLHYPRFTSVIVAAGSLLLACALAEIAPAQVAPGDVFVADNGGQRIYQYTPPNLDGIFTNSVSFPVGLASDAAGNVYEADNGSGNVYKFSSSGTKTLFASGFVGPTGLALDANGNLYVGDNGPGGPNGSIVQVTPAGAKTTFASGLSLPGGLAFDTAGNLYEGDIGTAHVFKFTPAGVKSTFASGIDARGVAVDSANNVYVACGICNAIYKYTPSGVQALFAKNLGTPQYLAIDAAGNIYVTDSGSSSGTDGAVYVFTPAAARTTLSSGLNSPRGITIVPSAPVAAQLQNVSTRLNVLTGDNALIGGFIVTGTVPKKVLLRAIGPSLTQFGVAGALQDPTLELHDSSGATIATNDNWRTTQIGGVITADQQADIQNSGAAPTNDKESAIIATLPPSNYTAIVRGVNDGTGVGSIEAYDLAPAAASKFGNISTRGFVDTGDNVMIGGFILGPASGSNAKVVVRGIGPSLTQFGVANALGNPFLELHNANGATLVTNDNWRQDPGATEIQNDGLAPKSDFESATLQVLAPGAYTAILSGVQNGTGVGLVEVYSVQ